MPQRPTFKHGACGYRARKCRCSICREGERIAQLNWRRKHPDKAKAILHRRKSNVRYQAYMQQYQLEYAQRVDVKQQKRESYRRRMADPKGRIKIQARTIRRRAQERGAKGTASPEQISARVSLYGGSCHICGMLGANSIDHVIPLVRGGAQWPSNLRPAHNWCNRGKRDRAYNKTTANLPKPKGHLPT